MAPTVALTISLLASGQLKRFSTPELLASRHQLPGFCFELLALIAPVRTQVQFRSLLAQLCIQLAAIQFEIPRVYIPPSHTCATQREEADNCDTMGRVC